MGKLTETDVLNIRAQLEDGVPRKELALRYGVPTETIAKIHRRNTFVRVGAVSVSDTHLAAMAAASQAKVMQAARELQTSKAVESTYESATCEGALSLETLGMLFGPPRRQP